MLEALGRRVRYGLGNCARFISRPWRQWDVEPELTTTIFGCSFGAQGWHHLRRTLQEYDADPRIGLQDTTLWQFLTRFVPTSISELTGDTPSSPLPLFVYPWGTFARHQVTARKDPWSSRFCGPSTESFVAEEFTRFIGLYERLKVSGYHPTVYPNSFIGGTWLIDSQGRRRFVVLQGNHRMAALAHLGARTVAVRALPGFLTAIEESEVASWPLVRSGACSEQHALSVFRLFFEQAGQHVERRLAPSQVA